MFRLLNGWTKDKVMDAIRKGNNGTRAVASPDAANCQYETPDGNHCFVGCFIPTGHEGLAVDGDVKDLYYACPDLEDLMPLEQEALQSFQRVHDAFKANAGVEHLGCMPSLVLSKNPQSLYEAAQLFLDLYVE